MTSTQEGKWAQSNYNGVHGAIREKKGKGAKDGGTEGGGENFHPRNPRGAG